MPFSLVCSHKGCYKQNEPYLDPKTDKVYCSECDNEITNVTYFAKVQMKTMKQFRIKTATSFAVKCKYCAKEDRPIILNNDIACSGCKKPMDQLSAPFKAMLKDKLKTVGKDI
jgi:hypothetical protein